MSLKLSRKQCPGPNSFLALQPGELQICENNSTSDVAHCCRRAYAVTALACHILVPCFGSGPSYCLPDERQHLLTPVWRTGTPCVRIENASATTIFSRYCATVITAPGDRPTVQIPAAETYNLVVTESGNTFQSYH